jgi:hypothetical protein
MPPATILAYKDLGKPAVRIEKAIDGVASFAISSDSLIATVESQRKPAVG